MITKGYQPYIYMHLYIAKFWNLMISNLSSIHFFLRSWRNFSNTFTVAITSPIALWALLLVTLKCMHKASKRLLGSSGTSLFANFLVHKIWFSMGVFKWRSPLWCKNQWSKVALCATKMWSSKNSKNFGNALSIVGASFTIKFVIPVRWVIKEGIGFPGFINVWKVSITFFPSNKTAAISVMRLEFLLSPVVSISTIIYFLFCKMNGRNV